MWARNPGWDVCVPTEGPRGLEVRMRETFLRKFLTKVMAEIVRHTQVIKKEKKNALCNTEAACFEPWRAVKDEAAGR